MTTIYFNKMLDVTSLASVHNCSLFPSDNTAFLIDCIGKLFQISLKTTFSWSLLVGFGLYYSYWWSIAASVWIVQPEYVEIPPLHSSKSLKWNLKPLKKYRNFSKGWPFFEPFCIVELFITRLKELPRDFRVDSTRP